MLTANKTVVLNKIGQGLKKDLVGYWPLDEASGTRRDLSGNELTLTDNNTVTGTDGPSRKLPLASQFTVANSEYLSRADETKLRAAATGLTLAIWVKHDGAFPGAGGYQNPIAKTDAGAAREYEVQWNGDNNRFIFITTEDGSTLKTAGFPLAPTADAYHLLVAWWSGTQLFAQQDGGVVTSGSATTSIYGSTNALLLGSNTGTSQFWPGGMAGFGKWDRALTAQERLYLYNGGIGRGFSLNQGFL